MNKMGYAKELGIEFAGAHGEGIELMPTHAESGRRGGSGSGSAKPGAGSPRIPAAYSHVLEVQLGTKTPCSCSCGSATLWGWHTASCMVLRCLVPLVMLPMVHGFEVLGALGDAPDGASASPSSAPAAE